MQKRRPRTWFPLAALLTTTTLALGQTQQPRQLTAADYAHAERLMPYNVRGLVDHAVERPAWLEGDRMLYRDTAAGVATYTLVDPARGTRAAAFDHARLAAAISAALPGQPAQDANRLLLSDLSFEDGDRTLYVTVGDAALRCDLSSSPDRCAPVNSAGKAAGRHPQNGLSPDHTRVAFIRDWNLWVRDLGSGKETQLTSDGVKDFGYSTDNAGWQHSDRPIVLWSPDSKKIATFQQDQRLDGEMYLVPVTNSHPRLEAWKYPLVGDEHVTLIERVVIDLATRKVVRLKMPPDQHRSTICDDVSCEGGWEDVQWAPDGAHLAFVSTSRDHRQEWLRVADTATGDVRQVYTETAPKFFESGIDKVNWRYLPGSDEFLWWTERTGWGHLYLYNLSTGKQKRVITHGEWNVAQVLHVDEAARRIEFTGVGREKGEDPYLRQFYSVDFDGKDLRLLTPENADHEITVSADGRYFVDIASTPTTPQTTTIKDSSGKLVLEVAREDISRLQAAGWKPLTPITVKGRDGKTDIYGFLLSPTSLDPARKYPLINNIYPGPQTGSCGDRSFHPAHRDMESLAELGFVVVCLDGMGTPWRSKAFHEAYFGDLGDNTLPDQVAGMRELASRYPYIDLDRAGIYGHSGGGNATAAAMLHYPDFFKVGIAESGNHDQRDYEDDWAEKWAGLEHTSPDGTSNYDSQANQNFARNLKGHLLLAHGTMDDNVPPNNTLLLVDALIKANKDFDLLLIPNVAHGYAAATPYMTRRRWDYFVRYLSGDLPPAHYELKPFPEVQRLLEGPSSN